MAGRKARSRMFSAMSLALIWPARKASMPSVQRMPSTHSWVSSRSKRSRFSAGASRNSAKNPTWKKRRRRCRAPAFEGLDANVIDPDDAAGAAKAVAAVA